MRWWYVLCSTCGFVVWLFVTCTIIVNANGTCLVVIKGPSDRSVCEVLDAARS